MSALPAIRQRQPGPEGMPASDLIAGRGAIAELLAGGAAGSSGSRLEAGALGASSEEARTRLERILGGEGGLVTTGQQPVLFGGPLYVVYKALSAIVMARGLERDTGRPHLACFWIASDDHDWDEVGTTSVIDRSDELHAFRLDPPAGRQGRAVGPTPAAAVDLVAHVDELSQALPESEFVDRYLDCLRKSYGGDASLSDGFAGALSGILDGRDFAWIDSASPAVKRASSPLFRRALEEAAAFEAAFTGSSERVLAAGYETPIAHLSGATNVFYDTGERRERLYAVDDDFRAGREGPALRREAVLETLEGEPDRFSANVALRPTLESWLLPVEATILGPGEVAYWLQLPGIFELTDRSIPSVVPRAAWSLVEAKIARVLDKTGTDSDDLADGGDALVRSLTRAGRPAAVDQALEALRSELERGLDALGDSLADSLPGVRSSVEKTRARSAKLLGGLTSRIDAAVRDSEVHRIDGLRRAARHLFPAGRPQERVINPLYFLARYGPDLIDELEARTEQLLAPAVASAPDSP